MINPVRNERFRITECKGIYVIIKSGRIIAKTASTLSLKGAYVIGATSIGSIKGLDDELIIQVLIRSAEEIAWKGEQCIIGREACYLSRYADILSLSPRKYEIDVDLVGTPPSLEAEICVSPVPVDGGLLVSGARPGKHTRMSPAPGSTRSWSLMISDPIRIGDVCVQRTWLWFFEPRSSHTKTRSITIRLETGDGPVNSIQTELLRAGMYSEAVIDVLIPQRESKVTFTDSANLTRPLFTMHTEGCGGVS